MPDIKKLTGTYEEIVRRTLPADFLMESADPVSQVNKDLPREPFIDSHGESITEYRARVSSDMMDNQISKNYTQGNLTGKIFERAVFLSNSHGVTATEYKRVKETLDKTTDVDEQKVLQTKLGELEQIIIENNLSMAQFKQNSAQLFFAYNDDNGVRCGICIDYDKTNPSTWMVSLIKNTTGEPEQRQVILLYPHPVVPSLENTGEATAPSSSVIPDFIQALGSSKIGRLLQDCISAETGQANLPKLMDLTTIISPKFTTPSRDEDQRQISALSEAPPSEMNSRIHARAEALIAERQALKEQENAKFEARNKRPVLSDNAVSTSTTYTRLKSIANAFSILAMGFAALTFIGALVYLTGGLAAPVLLPLAISIITGGTSAVGASIASLITNIIANSVAPTKPPLLKEKTLDASSSAQKLAKLSQGAPSVDIPVKAPRHQEVIKSPVINPEILPRYTQFLHLVLKNPEQLAQAKTQLANASLEERNQAQLDHEGFNAKEIEAMTPDMRSDLTAAIYIAKSDILQTYKPQVFDVNELVTQLHAANRTIYEEIQPASMTVAPPM